MLTTHPGISAYNSKKFHQQINLIATITTYKLGLYHLTIDGPDIFSFYGGFSINKEDVDHYLSFFKSSSFTKEQKKYRVSQKK